MVADHVAKRRTSMLKLVRKIAYPLNADALVSKGEEHVCRHLMLLHQRGPVPEDHFSWLVDQYIARNIEFQHSSHTSSAFSILGPAPSTRVEAATAVSAVWNRYEAKHRQVAVRDLPKRSNSPSASSKAAAEEATNDQGH